MTRTAGATVDAARVVLTADGVGRWTPWIAVGQVVEPGQVVGVVEVLGVDEPVVYAAGPAGRATAVTGARHHRCAVDHGAVLATLDRSIDLGGGAAAATSSTGAAAAGLAFVAPSSGRFYLRPAPGKAPFVAVGDVVRAGQTVCLLEVMKTFHRVTYGGAGLPDVARITAIAVAEDADVGPGDVLLRLAPLEEEAP
ncbi:MAG: biotin/lipoyl-containing protein [Kofleriaceae bacterium]